MRARWKRRVGDLKKEIPALYLALKDKRTPFLAEALAALTVGYALSPIDLIPDFIPVFGALDDLLLLPLMIACVVKLIPESVLEEKRRLSKEMWRDGRPKRWFYAIPIVLFYLLLFFLVLKYFLSTEGSP